MDSPDLADAFMLTFASDGITFTHGRDNVSWNKPIRRRLKGIV
jgi:hypothetical protein